MRMTRLLVALLLVAGACTTEASTPAATSAAATDTTSSASSDGGLTSAPTDGGSVTGGMRATSGSTRSGSTSATGDATTGQDSSGGPPAYSVELSLITTSNRAHPEMYGGWGPHLRGVMRDGDGVLWFTTDAGPDVLTNASIRYHRRGDTGWELFAQQPHLAGVQQNAASVLLGTSILSYSVNVESSTLEECYQSTSDASVHACNTVTIGGPYTTPADSNYVGAALSPDGTRVVWFTTVGGASSGQFIYTYNSGGGWNGPVVYSLPGYNTYEYLRASFTAPNMITWHGQLLLGSFPGGTFHPAIGQATIGQVPALQPLNGDGPEVDVTTGADLWTDPDSGDQHAIAQAVPQLAYYFRPGDESWADHAEPLHWFDDTFRGRFGTPDAEHVALVRGSNSGESGVDVWIGPRVPGQPIDWSAAEVVAVVTTVPGLERPSGIYVERETYQSEPVGGLEFALCGAYGESDAQLWHGSLIAR